MLNNERFTRTEALLGEEAMNKLRRARIAIFGVGGVGSYIAEALARSGVGSFVLVDSDIICESNINRQIHALTSTLGEPKVEAMKRRIIDINPDAEVVTAQVFYLPGTDGFSWDYDYIVDAVDTVTAKLDIISEAKKREIPVISSMGAGDKLDPCRLRIADIYETSVCPLARVMRRELKKRDINSLTVVYSTEAPVRNANAPGEYLEAVSDSHPKRHTPGSCFFVPSVAGLIIASQVVNDIIKFPQ